MKDKSKIQNIIIIVLMLLIIGLLIEPKINKTRILENNNKKLTESSKIIDSISQISDSLTLESKIQELKNIVLSFNNNDLGRYEYGADYEGFTIFDKKKAVIYHTCYIQYKEKYITTTFALQSGKIKVNDPIFKIWEINK